MADQFGTTRANLSNHLTCLRECGLVTATAEGRWVRYELADQRLAEGLRILAALDLPGTCGGGDLVAVAPGVAVSAAQTAAAGPSAGGGTDEAGGGGAAVCVALCGPLAGVVFFFLAAMA
jgi:hypothetical protein